MVLAQQDDFPKEGCVRRIRTIFPNLRPSEQKVAQMVQDHAEQVIHLSVTEMARACNVSDATIVKFSQRIGYSGFQELRINLAQELPEVQQPAYEEIQPQDTLLAVKDKIFAINQKALADTCCVLDLAELTKAVDIMRTAKHIHIYGVGASGIVAMDAGQKFARIGLPCHVFTDPHLAATMASLLEKGDIALGISHTGTTRDTVEALEISRAAGATTICITNYLQSRITKAADIVLLTSVAEADFRSGAMASRVAQLSIIDVIFIAVARMNYDKTIACLDKTRRAVANRRY